MLDWHDEQMPCRHRRDVHERDALIVAMDDARRRAAGDDLAEFAGRDGLIHAGTARRCTTNP